MKTRRVSIEDLNINIFVREELNTEHVKYLKGLIEACVELPEILISEDNDVVDGRHRLAAYGELGYTMVDCKVKKYNNRLEMILDALKANVGGSLPPSSGDITHTMQALLADGVSRAEIIKQVSDVVGFPAKFVRKHLDEIQSNLAKQRMTKAVKAVANDGKTAFEAAAEHGVNLKALQVELAGNGDDDTGKTNSVHVRSWFTTRTSNFNMAGAQTLSKVMKDLKDGLLDVEEVKEVVEHYNNCIDRIDRTRQQWLARFGSLNVVTKAVVVVHREKQQKKVKAKGGSALSRMGLTKKGGK